MFGSILFSASGFAPEVLARTAETGLVLLVESAAKATIPLLAGLAAIALLRGSAASTRHLIWLVAIVSTLLVPALAPHLPAWAPASLPPAVLGAVFRSPPIAALDTPGEEKPAPTNDAGGSIAPAAAPAGESRSGPSSDALRNATTPLDGFARQLIASPGLALFVLWLAGAFISLAPFVAGRLSLARLARSARPVRDPQWLAAAHAAARTLELSRPFELLLGPGTTMPLTWGIRGTRVMLPEDAREWPEARRRAVLLHELAHVKRHDCLTQAVAQIACAAYWFHPLVWYSAARLRAERERACDDHVLRAEMRASDYADHLLAVARAARRLPLPAFAAVMFARPSQLEGRLLAVLDDRRSRTPTTPARVTATAAAALALVLPLAAFQPPAPVAADTYITSDGRITVRANSRGDRAADTPGAPSEVHRFSGRDAALDQRFDWALAQADATLDHGEFWIGWSVVAGDGQQGGMLDDSHGIDFSTLGSGYGGPMLEDVLDGRSIDEAARELAVLIRIRAGGRSPADFTRLRCQTLTLPAALAGTPLYWLGRVEAAQSARHLIGFDTRWATPKLRGAAIDIVGHHPAPEVVVPYLRRILHSSATDDLRAEAAEALGKQSTDESLDLLAETARGERSQRVRMEAIEALGELRQPEAIQVLAEVARSKTQTEQARREAVESMGDRATREALPELDAITGMDASDDPVAPSEPQEPEWPEDSDESRLQVEAVETLGQFPEAEALPRLRRILQTHPNPYVRREAIETIAGLGTPAALAVVDEAIWQGQNRQLQRAAVEDLASFHIGGVMARLERVARQHPSEEVQIEAVETLGGLKGEDPLPLLGDLARHGKSVRVMIEATETLGDTHDARAVDILARLIREHPNVQVRREAIETLGDLDPDRAVPVLEELLSKPAKPSGR